MSLDVTSASISMVIWRSPHRFMAKVLDCGLEMNEFKLQSHYYVHIQVNTLGKGMNPFIPHLC